MKTRASNVSEPGFLNIITSSKAFFMVDCTPRMILFVFLLKELRSNYLFIANKNQCYKARLSYAINRSILSNPPNNADR